MSNVIPFAGPPGREPPKSNPSDPTTMFSMIVRDDGSVRVFVHDAISTPAAARWCAEQIEAGIEEAQRMLNAGVKP